MGLGGYMRRIAAEVAAYETTRKQAESEPTRGDEIEMLTEQRSTSHSSHIIDGPPRRCLFQSPSIKELALDGKFSTMDVLVINDRWLWGQRYR